MSAPVPALEGEEAEIEAFPPPPHDPRERVVVGRAGTWEVRAFAEDDRRFAYFVPRGLWHAQLWEPTARFSVLTPSRLTGGAWELFPFQDWKARFDDVMALRLALAAVRGPDLPSDKQLAALEAWFVQKPVRAQSAPGLL